MKPQTNASEPAPLNCSNEGTSGVMPQIDKDRQAQIEWLFHTISDMEAPLREVSDLAQALLMIALTLDDDIAGPLATIAGSAKDRCTQIQERRAECFHELHALIFGTRKSSPVAFAEASNV